MAMRMMLVIAGLLLAAPAAADQDTFIKELDEALGLARQQAEADKAEQNGTGQEGVEQPLEGSATESPKPSPGIGKAKKHKNGNK